MQLGAIIDTKATTEGKPVSLASIALVFLNLMFREEALIVA